MTHCQTLRKLGSHPFQGVVNRKVAPWLSVHHESKSSEPQAANLYMDGLPTMAPRPFRPRLCLSGTWQFQIRRSRKHPPHSVLVTKPESFFDVFCVCIHTDMMFARQVCVVGAGPAGLQQLASKKILVVDGTSSKEAMDWTWLQLGDFT